MNAEPTPDPRQDCPLWKTFPLRAADMDARGHVNNANYLTFFEIARRAFFEAHPIFQQMEAAGRHPVLKEQACAYHQQLRYPAAMAVGLRLADLRARTFRFEYALILQDSGTLVADGHTTHVWIDAAHEKAVPIPTEVAQTLRKLAPSSSGSHPLC